MANKHFKIAKNRGFSNHSEVDVFNGVTSLTELAPEGGYNMKENNEFTEEDKLKNEPLNLWKYKENKEISGKVIRIQNGQYGDMVVLDVNGTELFLPTVSALSKLSSEDNIGKKVKLVYTGEKKGKTGRVYGTFDIYIK